MTTTFTYGVPASTPCCGRKLSELRTTYGTTVTRRRTCQRCGTIYSVEVAEHPDAPQTWEPGSTWLAMSTWTCSEGYPPVFRFCRCTAD